MIVLQKKEKIMPQEFSLERRARPAPRSYMRSKWSHAICHPKTMADTCDRLYMMWWKTIETGNNVNIIHAAFIDDNDLTAWPNNESN